MDHVRGCYARVMLGHTDRDVLWVTVGTLSDLGLVGRVVDLIVCQVRGLLTFRML